MNRTNRIMNNKEITLDLYAAAAESAYPGKGTAAREIIASGWDDMADHHVDAQRIQVMSIIIDTKFSVNCARGIVERNRSLNEKLRALKN